MKFKSVKHIFIVRNKEGEILALRGKRAWSTENYAKDAINNSLIRYFGGSRAEDREKIVNSGKVFLIYDKQDEVLPWEREFLGYEMKFNDEVYVLKEHNEFANLLIQLGEITIEEIS